MRAIVTVEWRALTEEWTQRWWATLPTGPIVLVYDSSGNQLGAQRRAYGKRDVDGRPRVRLDSGNPATKGDESKTREDIEAEGTATTKPTGDLVITRLSISALSPFTRLVSSASLYLHPLFQYHLVHSHQSDHVILSYKSQVSHSRHAKMSPFNAVLGLHCSTGPCTRRTDHV